ncbi:MAG: S-layer homology domain-containing protein [Candidatus Fermentithermobacillus carboniphilus]|uniref:S-layer homology domain-containing protein n=1 Tax=Candidatus Fermentithermobacillus carboniphilus TaxID=3085328 RepID=A0AAT9LC45_9FIRM|nr:MAG: S-layer homology domain-containing protein [Candidatus Fermentithermobacillus carboniphilus]
MLKKLIATALAAAMIFGLVSVGFAATSPFPDTAGVEQEAAIAKLKALGLVKGDENGNFRPYSTINRAEFTAMVVRMLNLETAASYLNTPTVFPDVTEQWSWAYGYINVATGRGLIKGFEDGTFRPGEPVTQAQALTILLRALGYNDNLPGDWPIDYVLKGAELGVIGSGFVGNVGATRALVAELVANTLDQAPVKEDKDAPGNFIEKWPAGTTLYEDVFGLRTAGKEQSVSGKVAAKVNTTDKKIQIGDTWYDYADAVAVFGKDNISDLFGQFVSATFNKYGKIIFIEVTTAGEVVGDVTAIDTVNLKVTVGGTSYNVLSTAEIYKNGERLTDSTTIAGALVAINGASAKLLLDTNGKVYRIDASKLDLAGTLKAKRSVIGSDGTITNQIDVELTAGGSGIQTYSCTSSTVIVRNGASVGFAALETGDDLKFSATGTALLYLDAWKNVVTGYKVTAVVATSDGRTVTAVKDGVESTFAVDKNYTEPINVNTTYDFSLNRAGKITKATVTAVAGPKTGEVKTVSGKDQVWNGTKSRVDYRVSFSDGSVLVLNDLTIDEFKKNGNPIAIVDANGDGDTNDDIDKVVTVWNNVAANDLFRLEAGYDIFAYSPKLTGYAVREAASDKYSVSDGVYTTATVITYWNTEVTLNGVRVSNTSPAAQAAPGDGTYLITVTFTGKDDNGVPIAASVSLEKLTDAKAYAVKSITTEDDVYTFTLDTNAGATTVKVNKDSIIVKDGSKVTAADIKIGDLLQAAAADTNGINPYVKATTDEDKPVVTVTQAKWTAATQTTKSKLEVSFTVNEGCPKAYVWIAGTQYTATRSGATWTLTVEDLAAKPAKVTVAAVDYAGLVSEAVDANVTE